MCFCWLSGMAECWPRLCHRKLDFTSTPAIFSSPTLTHFFKVQVIGQMCTRFSKVNIKHRLVCTWSRQARVSVPFNHLESYLMVRRAEHLPCCDKSQHRWPGSLPLLLSTAYHLWHKYVSLKHTLSSYTIIYTSKNILEFSTHLEHLRLYTHSGCSHSLCMMQWTRYS